MADLSANKADAIKADAIKADASKADVSKADADHKKHKTNASNYFIAIANMISKPSYLHHFAASFGQMHLLEKSLDDFLVRALVVFNLFVKLLANVVVFGVHAFLGFPPRVRVHPVLNDARLVARRQVNELVNVLVRFILNPFVRFYVHGFSLHVRAVNGTLVHIHALQVVHNDGAHALHDAVRFRKFQILQRDFQGFHKIAQLNGVLAFFVQKHIQVELRVVGDVVGVMRDAIANANSITRQRQCQRIVIHHLGLNCIHQHLVLMYHVLVLRHHFLVMLH